MMIKIFKKFFQSENGPFYEQVFEGEIDCKYKSVENLVNQLNTEGHLLLRADSIDDGDVIFYENSYLKICQPEFSPMFFEKLSSQESKNFEYEKVFIDADLVEVLCVEPFIAPYKTYIKDTIFKDYIGDIISLNNKYHTIKIYYNKNHHDIVNREYKGVSLSGPFFVCEVKKGNLISLSEDVSVYFKHLFKDYFFPFYPNKKASKNAMYILDDEEVLQYV